MFEHPWALVGLLLIPLWILWARSSAPLPWRVGGLQFFRGLVRVAPTRTRRAWPPSSWLGVLALLLGTLAAAGLRGRLPALILRDRSLSCRLRTGPWPDPGLTGAEVVDWGAERDAPLPGDLIRRAVELAAGHRLTVLSDQPPPLGLPEGVRWLGPPFARANAAILSVIPTASGWRLSWAAWNCKGPFELRAGDRALARVEGTEGELPLEALPEGTRLELRVLSGEPQTSREDDFWTLPAPPRFFLPPNADSRWEDALRAAWPGCGILRRTPRAGEVGYRVRFGRGGGEPLFRTDPFVSDSELDAVAAIAARIAPLRAALPAPRPRVECAPPLRPGHWPESGVPDRAPGRSDLPRWLATLGLGAWLLTLLLRRSGR